jgi:hypothetical protein
VGKYKIGKDKRARAGEDKPTRKTDVRRNKDEDEGIRITICISQVQCLDRKHEYFEQK